MKLEVHTLRWGTADWLDACVPTLEAWCKRHGYKLIVWDDTDRGYPSPKFCEIDMVRAFLAGGSDAMLYVDADVHVHSEAPAFPDFDSFLMTGDVRHDEHEQHWIDWCRENYKIEVKGPYQNAGVWATGRHDAKQLLAAMESLPMIECFQEQHWMNLVAHEACMSRFNLPPEWNRYGRTFEPSWFFHLWGNTKTEDLGALRYSGILDRKPDGLRYSFDPGHTPYEDKTLVLQFVKDCGMANQMFELAAGLGIARRLGIPLRWNWNPTPKREFGLVHFGLGVLPFREYPVVSSRLGQGNTEIVDAATQAAHDSAHRFPAISHPFQAEECFANVADEVRELFKLEPFELKVPAGATAIGMQVRRGDYIGHPRLNVVTPDYFRNAMEWMRERHPRCHFFVVSDDPQWCQRQFGPQLDVTVMPPQEPIDGLRTLASCEAHIISNSTFGWWGAWLGEAGPVVVPEIWHHKPGSYGDWNPVPDRWHRVSVKPKGSQASHYPIKVTTVIEQPAPMIPRAIVYPWHAGQARWHELRYSLRSIEKHFADKECPIFILGTHRPDFLVDHPRVKYVGAWTYTMALTQGVQIAETVMWMNDDIVLLKDVGWDDVSVPRYVREIDPQVAVAAPEQEIPWREACRRVLKQLVAEGTKDLKLFSTHTPYVYERERAMKVLRRFGVHEKMPLELAYFNTHPKGATLIGEDRVHGLPLDGAIYLNYADRHLTAELRDELRRRFPDFAPWELKIEFSR